MYSRSSNTTGPKVLIVDGFDRIGAYTKSFHNFATSFFNELKSNATLQINTSANEKVEDGTILLTNYDMVFWFTGDDSSANIALSANEKAKIRTYLESGGKLVLSGSEIAYNLGRSAAAAYDLAFMNGYLKSSYVGDGVVGDTPAVGITGTAFEGVSCAIGSIYVDYFPDNITAFGGATNVFSYTTAGSFGGIVYTGLFGTSTISSQLIYVGFGIENISPSDRANFMKKALTYFNVTLDVNEIVFIEKNKITAYPNPFNNLFEINFNTTIPNNGNITIYDVTGKQVWEQNFKNNTEGKIVVSTNALSNGLYFVKISLENGTSESFKMIKQN